MRKTVCFTLVLLLVFLFGCSKIDANSDMSISEGIKTETASQDINEENTVTTDVNYDENVIIPNVDISLTNLADKFTNSNTSNFTIINALGNYYYGYKSTFSDSGINDEFILIDSETGKETKLIYPEGLPSWSVGSGSMVVLDDRYLYEWNSYNSEFLEASFFDVKLTRINSKSGNVEIVDELNYNTPLIYMCKINETEFLSYSVTQAPSDKTEYAVISSAWIYNINGEKKEIIQEKYENDISWTDSEGILIERFAVKDGELFGLGRRRISGNYQFFLYHYDKDGNLLSEEALVGFDKIIGSEQMLELNLVGDYIAFRTYESLTTYICKKSFGKIELIVKGADRQVQYAVANDNIFFIESNVNVYSGEVENKECPLYIIDTQNQQIHAKTFSIAMKDPYFVGIQSLSNGSLTISYCDDGTYDPMQIQYYIIDKETIEKEITNS